MNDDLILEKQAREFRSTNGYNDSNCIRLQSLLSALTVITIFKPLGEGFSGMAVKVGEGEDTKRFILINSNHAIGKQHFTICHELYHLYIQQNFSSMVCTAGKFDSKGGEEFKADVFAAYLLLPEAGVKALIPNEELGLNKITLKTILKIEQYFSCSRRALLYRLKQLGIINGKHYDLFTVNIRKGAWEHGYNTALYKDGNQGVVIGDYGSLAKELFDTEKISEAHYHSLLQDLGQDIKEIEGIENDEA